MSELLHGIFGNEMGSLIAAVFLLVGLVDIAFYRFVLGPMYDRLRTEEAEKGKKAVRLAIYAAASICILLGLSGMAVVAGML